MTPEEILGAAAEKLGFTVAPTRPAGEVSVVQFHGSIGDARVRLEMYGAASGGLREVIGSPGSYHFVALATCSIPHVISLRAEPSGLARLFAGRDLLIGDDAFDEQVRVEGNELHLRGVLRAPTRKAVSAAIEGGAIIANGAITTYMRADVDAVVYQAKRIADAAEWLRVEKQGAEYLTGANAMNDPVAGVRVQCLDALVRIVPASARTKWIVDELRKVEDAVVREAADRAYARLTGRASAGQVAIAAPQGGELSEAAEKGSLSDPDDED